MHADRCAFIETQGGQQNSRHGNVYQSDFELERKKGNVAYRALSTQSQSVSIHRILWTLLNEYFFSEYSGFCFELNHSKINFQNGSARARPGEMYPWYMPSLAMSPSLVLQYFFNIVQNAFEPPPLFLEHLVTQFRPLLGHLLGYYKFYSSF